MTFTPAYGRKPKTRDPRDYRAHATAPYTGTFVDLSAGFPDLPYDQLALGGCVSNAVAAAADFARAKQGLPPLSPPSRLFLYFNGRGIEGDPIDQDTGLQVRTGFKSLAQFGAPPETDWPYDITRFADKPGPQAYTDGKADEATVYGAVTDVDAMIASGFPVPFGFDVYTSFEAAKTAATGVMPVPKAGEKLLGGHCTVACSTPLDGADPRVKGVAGVKYRKVRNSWGHDGTWGIPDQPGYYWHPADLIDGTGNDCWMVSTLSSSVIPTPPPPAGGSTYLLGTNDRQVYDHAHGVASRHGYTDEEWLTRHLRHYFNLP